MSLIEEALRKQREETEGAKPAPLHVAPPPPSEPPPIAPRDELQSEPESAPRKTWPLLLLAGLGALALLALVAWLLVFGVGLWSTPSAVPPPAVAVQVKPAPVPAKAVSVAPGSAAALPPASASTGGLVSAVSSPTPAASNVVSQSPAPTVPAPVTAPAPVASPSNAAPVLGASGRTSAPPALAVETPKPPVVWPKLAVYGLIGGTGGRKGAVIVNGQMLGVGEGIEGARVVAIDKDGAHLSFGGETRVLKVGGTTD